MHTFSHTCTGHSHLQSGRPCQDASYAGTIGDLHLAIVSDGHGSQRYTRSDIGSQLAVTTAQNAIRKFFFETETQYDGRFFDFRRETLRQLPLCKDSRDLFDTEQACQDPLVKQAIRLLIEYLVGSWNEAIKEHAQQHPLTEQETKYATRHKHTLGTTIIDPTILYGCTLIVAVMCEDFWLVLQIGDGKCVAFHDLSKQPLSQPVIEDAECFLNKTTSLCDSNASFEFSYCLGGASTLPYAIILGTDGIDNSWGTDEKLYNFYIDTLKNCAASPERLHTELQFALPMLSQYGSQDDMSVAAIVDMSQLYLQLPSLVGYQIDQRRKQIEELSVRRAEIQKNINQLLEYFNAIDVERLMRDMQNMKADLEHRTQEQERLQKKLDELLMESVYTSCADPSASPKPKHYDHHPEDRTDLPF